ncbi:MAG: hypothetical protein R3E66_21815 [bacterium]
MRFFFVVAFASTAFNCKCEDSVRKAMDEKRPAPASAPEVVSKATAEIEPNDAPERATGIALGHELRPLHGELSSASDIDWYSLSSAVSPSEIIELRVSPDGTDTNLSLHVQSGADNAPPLTYDVGGSGEAEVIAAMKIGETPLKFAIRAVGADFGAYTIQATRRMGRASRLNPTTTSQMR